MLRHHQCGELSSSRLQHQSTILRLIILTLASRAQASLEKAKSWIRELQRQADPSIIVALVGNKADLSERRAVETEDAQRYADEENLLFFETSAKTSENVSAVFEAIGALSRRASLACHRQPIAVSG